MEKNGVSSIEKSHGLIGIVVGSLSILGILYYTIGYAYYWGSLSVFGLEPNLSPLMFDDYIALGFAATVIALLNIFKSFDLMSIVALLSLIFVCWFIVALVVNNKSKLNPNPERLNKLVQQIIRFFNPAKGFFLDFLGIFVFAAGLFSVLVLLAIPPIAFFKVGMNQAEQMKAENHCYKDSFKCSTIKTKENTWVGRVIASNKDEKVFFSGLEVITVQKKDIISETYQLVKKKSLGKGEKVGKKG